MAKKKHEKDLSASYPVRVQQKVLSLDPEDWEELAQPERLKAWVKKTLDEAFDAQRMTRDGIDPRWQAGWATGVCATLDYFLSTRCRKTVDSGEGQ